MPSRLKAKCAIVATRAALLRRAAELRQQPSDNLLERKLRLYAELAERRREVDARLEREIRDWSLALGREWSPLSALCVRLRAAKDGALRRAARRQAARRCRRAAV